MPIIKRIESDLFVFADVVDYLCNPVNLVQAPGAGLAKEFRNRVPDHLFFEPYKEACRSGELRMGTVQVLDETDNEWSMINFPTKRHYYDTSNKEDIVRGLEALRAMLLTDRYRYASIGLPMLGCGLGKQDYEVVYPLMVDHLSDLEATILLSMSPERTEMRPRYLVVVGPPDQEMNDDNKQVIDDTIDKVLEKWGTSLSDYEGVVSGGLPGTDAYVCGTQYGKDYEDTFVYKKTGKLPIVVRQNEVRNGPGAMLHQSNLLCEIAHDIILFKPVGMNNNRMSHMQAWIRNDREKRAQDGHPPRRMAVFGDHSETYKNQKILANVD